MSILIKGVSMPKYGELNITIDALGGVAYTDKDMKEHEVIEVPTPHGDLIDREEHKHFLEDKLGGCLVLQVHIAWLNEQPTILEGEE